MEEGISKKESKPFRFTASQGQGAAVIPSLVIAELFRKKLINFYFLFNLFN